MKIAADKYLHKVWLILTMTSIGLVAVNQASGQGRNEEVTIIAPYIPSIGDAIKIPFRPEFNPPESTVSGFNYEYITKSLETKIEPESLDPVRVSEGTQEDLYRNYAKIGVGNYWTPYAEFIASSLRSEKYQFGARLKHHSSQGGLKGYGPSGFSHNMISAFGSTFIKNHTLSGNISYSRDVVHFYGFRTDSFPALEISEDDIRQRYQHLKAIMEFGSNYITGNKLDHNFRLEYHYFSDIYQARESQLSFYTNLHKNFADRDNDFQHALGMEILFDLLNFKDSISSYDPLYIELKPVYSFSIGQYAFKAGLHIDMVNESTPEGSDFSIEAFPTLSAEITILEKKLIVFAEVGGEKTINSFRRLSNINPYITSAPILTSTEEQIKIQGGLTGNAGGLNFLVNASYAYINDMPLFVTDTSLMLNNKFIVMYDNMSLLKVKASLSYTRINNLKAGFTASYYHYIPKNEEKAWQMPDFEVGFDAAYLLNNKYFFKTSMLLIGTRYAKAFENGIVVPAKMNGAFDLNLGFEYRISKMISAFIDGNNLLNKHYQRWYHYPVQGIQVMLGAKFSF